jgi:hypothetical protein
MERRRNSIGKSKEYTVGMRMEEEDMWGHVCEDGDRNEYDKNTGREGRGGKVGSVSVLITKKGRKPSLRNALCTNLSNCSWIDNKNYKKPGLLSCTLVVQSVKT